MFNKLKQFKDLKDQAKVLQDALSKEHAEGSASFGKVKVVMNGNLEVTSVTIDPDISSNISKIQDAVKEATNEAIKKTQKIMAEKMRSMGGFNLPGME